MPKLVANTANMDERDWLELRRDGIGGSDAAAIAGQSKYASPVMVYMNKLGLHEPNKKDNVREAATWGHLHEPTIREEFKRRINAEREAAGLPPLKVIHRKAIFAHDEFDFIRTNLDGFIHGHELGKGIFEAKTAHYMLRDEWAGDDVPNAYYIQVQHNMAVMNAQYAYLAVLIGGNQYKHYFIPRDEEFISYLITIETAFWNNHILTRVPPAMAGIDAEKEMLNDQYPDSASYDDYIVTLPNVCIDLVERVEVAKQLIDELTKEKQALENEVKAMLGSTEMAFAGPHKVTWKTASNGNRPLRIKLDSSSDKQKFYDKRRKDLEQQRKAIEKEVKSIEKELKAAEKAAEKERKAKDKAEKAALAAAKKALKAAEQTKSEVMA